MRHEETVPLNTDRRTTNISQTSYKWSCSLRLCHDSPKNLRKQLGPAMLKTTSTLNRQGLRGTPFRHHLAEKATKRTFQQQRFFAIFAPKVTESIHASHAKAQHASAKQTHNQANKLTTISFRRRAFIARRKVATILGIQR